jgi:hypothetical protein
MKKGSYIYYEFITYNYIGRIIRIHDTHLIVTIIECTNPRDIGKDIAVAYNKCVLVASTREELNKLITFR